MKNSSLRSSKRSTSIDAQSKWTAWLLDSNLPARVCNVLTANGVTDEATLRQMLAVPGGEAVFHKMTNMGKKSVWALKEWAEQTSASEITPFDMVVIYSTQYAMYMTLREREYTPDVSLAGRYIYSEAVEIARTEKGLQVHRVVDKNSSLCSSEQSTPILSANRSGMFEDELPAGMPAEHYDVWFAHSQVIDGVRMGPRYPFEDMI